jgi:hypothetical protein
VGRAKCKLIRHTGSKHLYERATFFKRLAAGAADAKFAAKLEALVDEYEAKAARAETPATLALQNSPAE